MQRILWKHIFVKAMTMISLGLVTIGAFYGILFLVGGGHIDDSTSALYASYMCGLVVLLHNGPLTMLPDAVFIMPISREQREKMIKCILMVIWLIASLWVGTMMFWTDILQFDVEQPSECFELIIVCLLIFSAAYFLMYYKYFEAIKSLGTYGVVGIAFLPVLIMTFIMDCMSLEEDKTLYVIVISVGCMVNLIIDIGFHQKYFQNMVSYYAGYESSHHLMEKKVRV